MNVQLDPRLIHRTNDSEVSKTLPESVDIAVIGAGPAGLSAGIYAQRKGLRTLVIGSDTGGQVNDTSSVENYPGFASISGESLGHRFYDHARSLNISFQKGTNVIEIVNQGNTKVVKMDNGTSVKTKAVIIATGSLHRKLNVKGEDRLSGRGVAYCAICDGPLFQDRQVVVAGGGNAAVEAAIDLSKTAKSVSLVHRSQFRADKILLDRMDKLKNVDVYLDTHILEILGDNKVTGVRIKNRKTHIDQIIQVEGVFVEIGYVPNTELVKEMVAMNEKGEILTNIKMQTSIPGIFAAGDVVEGPYKQIVIAAGDGAKAALSANEYINLLSNEEELNNEIA